MNAVQILRQLTARVLEAASRAEGEHLGHHIWQHRMFYLGEIERRLNGVGPRLGDGRIVTLNCGMGADSIAMLCLLLEGQLIAQDRLVRLEDVSAVVFADTGAEWRHTYEVLPLVQALCEQTELRFIYLRKPAKEGDSGWQQWLHTKPQSNRKNRVEPAWRSSAPQSIEQRAAEGYYHLRPPIMEDYQSRSTVVSMSKGDCSANHKILPIRRLIQDLAAEKFGVPTNTEWSRDVRAGTRRPHLTLVGYAADETRRLEHDGTSPAYVEEAYPLIELGHSKTDNARVLARWGLEVRKSGCRMCVWQPVSWYWALQQEDITAFAEVVAYERAAMERNPRMTVLPSGVPLEHAVAAWREENPDATVESVLNKTYERCERVHGTPQAFEALSDAAPGQQYERSVYVQVIARVLLRRRGAGHD